MFSPAGQIPLPKFIHLEMQQPLDVLYFTSIPQSTTCLTNIPAGKAAMTQSECTQRLTCDSA